MSDDQAKIKVAREYFMRADQGRAQTSLNCSRKKPKSISRNSDSDLDLDGIRFLKW
jgi:hypothetical protein